MCHGNVCLSVAEEGSAVRLSASRQAGGSGVSPEFFFLQAGPLSRRREAGGSGVSPEFFFLEAAPLSRKPFDHAQTGGIQ